MITLFTGILDSLWEIFSICDEETTLDFSICAFKIYVILQRHVAVDNYRLAQEYLSCICGEEMGKKMCTKIYLFAFKDNNIL